MVGHVGTKLGYYVLHWHGWQHEVCCVVLCKCRRCHLQACHAAAVCSVAPCCAGLQYQPDLTCAGGITWVGGGADSCGSAGCRHSICGAQEPLSPETLMRDWPLHEEEQRHLGHLQQGPAAVRMREQLPRQRERFDRLTALVQSGA